MILQALTEYYDQLLQKEAVPDQGWSMANVSYALSINDAGELENVISLKQEVERGKKKVVVPNKIKVPAQVKKSSGFVSNFLCENSSYLMGFDGKGDPERAIKCFNCCKELHINMLRHVDDDCAKAILLFFENWNPREASEHPELTQYMEDIIAGANLIFRYRGNNLQEYPSIQMAWKKSRQDNEEGVVMRCLVTGERASIARLHPSVKGIRGAQAAGASLVSFNAPSYSSYGKEQSYNAPVSEQAAAAYTTVLNYMLGESDYHQLIGDTTVLYWAEDGEDAYADLVNMMLWGSDDNEVSLKDLSDITHKIAHGDMADFKNIPLQPDNRFYFLGIAPNAARLSIRFFWQDTFKKFAENIEAHYQRLAIVKPEFEKLTYLPVWWLLKETVNPNSNDKAASPLLAGAVLRAILNNMPYPAALLNQTMIRIRAEKKITYGKASIIKAYWLMNGSDKNKEVLQFMLNEESTNVPYVLGRTFAVLQNIQEKAIPDIKATIKERYFNSAATTPSTVFPSLLRLAMSHLTKIGKDNKKLENYFNSELGKLADKIEMNEKPIPKQLNLEAQGIFILGYYHQVQKRNGNKEGKDNV